MNAYNYRKKSEMESAHGTLNMYAFEVYLNVESSRRFYVAHIRARSLTEASVVLNQSLRKAFKSPELEIVRTFDLGSDRSYLRGNKRYRVELVALTWFCPETYASLGSTPKMID